MKGQKEFNDHNGYRNYLFLHKGNAVTSGINLTYDMVTKYIPTPRFIAGERQGGL